MRTFSVVVERDPETGLYVGYVPGWPGAHTQDATLDELEIEKSSRCCSKMVTPSSRQNSWVSRPFEWRELGIGPCTRVRYPHDWFSWASSRFGNVVRTTSIAIPTVAARRSSVMLCTLEPM